MATMISLRRRGGESRRETFRGEGVITLGRSPENDVLLLCPRVSKRHATAQVKDGALWLRDLASMNGTFVNGAAVREPMIVTSGDLVQIGDFSLTFELGRTRSMPAYVRDVEEPTSAGMNLAAGAGGAASPGAQPRERELAATLTKRLVAEGLTREAILRVIDAMVDVVASGPHDPGGKH